MKKIVQLQSHNGPGGPFAVLTGINFIRLPLGDHAAHGTGSRQHYQQAYGELHGACEFPYLF